ncbi:DUF4172 domain-containing protein [Xenorhabdus bovienii]|uniref:DUF4172 domain-containing protein n=2 Tax=Xenorhabdus bovienii TaxID=40576 RepID=UPI0023B21112|nr:DUF4172 domain-containing protein [Xenorhabdus bovienii]MDE9452747.1 DUF4172 domain-containing protein [Xenorhabdus bovienii]MDE9550179.1 DUF4172 domain-containing protein [Xenorhabdus bovienii]MDE9555036.1 DUF4172 domain-containing protein [Xenorhabdus bovienii]MDE9565356.1 DUF4172 domain-containing protein [Xenorhabdus bovienii]
MWIWQHEDWPDFQWDESVLAPVLRQIHFNQGLLLGRSETENTEQTTLVDILPVLQLAKKLNNNVLANRRTGFLWRTR